VAQWSEQVHEFLSRKDKEKEKNKQTKFTPWEKQGVII